MIDFSRAALRRRAVVVRAETSSGEEFQAQLTEAWEKTSKKLQVVQMLSCVA